MLAMFQVPNKFFEQGRPRHRPDRQGLGARPGVTSYRNRIGRLAWVVERRAGRAV